MMHIWKHICTLCFVVDGVSGESKKKEMPDKSYIPVKPEQKDKKLWCCVGGSGNECLVLSRELVREFSHRKEI